MRFSLGTRLRSLVVDIGYLFLLLALTPWLLFLVIVRRRGVGSLSQRFGFIEVPIKSGPRIWLHAVSVGELEAALPLVNALTAEHPELELVVSTTTASAHELAAQRLPDHPRYYYPVDFGNCVRRALRRARPDLILLMELEVWPNFTLNARAAGVPIVVANGRVSERGHERMAKAGLLLRGVLRRVECYLVQNPEYKQRLVSLGVEESRVEVVGNLKLDRAMVEDCEGIRARFEEDWGYASGSPRWIAGCTHSGEEALLLEVHERLRRRFEGLSLILAPRHVERAPDVAQNVRDRGLEVVSFEEGPRKSAPDVVILDVTGRLGHLYAAADVAFVGGSLIPRGGHNVLEPVLAGTPTLYGPNTHNFKEIVGILAAGNAAGEVADSDQLGARIAAWLTDRDERQSHARRALAAIDPHRGAAARTVASVVDFLGLTETRASAPELQP